MVVQLCPLTKLRLKLGHTKERGIESLGRIKNVGIISKSNHALLLPVFQLLSHVQTFVIPWASACPAPLFSMISRSWLKFMSIESVMLPVSSSATPSSFFLQSFQHQNLFQWVSSSHQVARVLELQLQNQPFQWIFRVDFLQHWLVWFACCSRNSQESSPAPDCESINSSALSFLCGPNLTFVHECWLKKHSFD